MGDLILPSAFTASRLSSGRDSFVMRSRSGSTNRSSLWYSMARPASKRASQKVSFRPARKTSPDRKSTRLNSSHGYISYAGFCLKKKKSKDETHDTDVKKIVGLSVQHTYRST